MEGLEKRLDGEPLLKPGVPLDPVEELVEPVTEPVAEEPVDEEEEPVEEDELPETEPNTDELDEDADPEGERDDGVLAERKGQAMIRALLPSLWDPRN